MELPRRERRGSIAGRPFLGAVRAPRLPLREHADQRVPAEQPGKPVETVVPVVVARDAEKDAASAARPDLLEHLVPRLDHAPQDLAAGGDGVGGVAAEEEDVAARQELAVGALRSAYSANTRRATAALTSRSSPVSATKSIQSGRPRRSTRVGASDDGRLQDAARRGPEARAGRSGRIQSRVSTAWLATIEAATRRRWPSSAVLPNQRMAYGGCAPRWKRVGAAPSPRQARGTGGRLVARRPAASTTDGSLMTAQAPSRQPGRGTDQVASGAGVADGQAHHHAADDRTRRGGPPRSGHHGADDLHAVVDDDDGVGAHLGGAFS